MLIFIISIKKTENKFQYFVSAGIYLRIEYAYKIKKNKSILFEGFFLC